MNEHVVKDVQDELLKERRRKRRPGQVPYPLDYSNDLLDFDVWSHLYVRSLLNTGLTIHPLDPPPTRVLDLGCGGGFWIINAAKEWTETTFVGLDIKKIQPDLDMFANYSSIAPRVQWVHRNLLERLPFPPDEFDFVRICGIGLGVPEDEWQDLLEEVYRILKPGSYLEIVEDDLIFPCGPPPRRRVAQNSVISSLMRPIHSNVSLRSLSTARSSTLFELITPISEHPPSLAKTSSLESHQSLSPRSPPMAVDTQHVSDPQDHSKVKSAWEGMLNSRFLAPQLLSVLPFYLSSSAFVEIQSHPPLQISLPPNSGSRDYFPPRPDTESDVGVFDDFKKLLRRSSSESNKSRKSIHESAPYLESAPTCTSMHLLRSVRLICGCKESIWTEYEKLYGDEPTVHPLKERPNTNTCRDEFETAWTNWENDMMDRIGLREKVQSSLGWPEPLHDLERPNWRLWRDTLGNTDTPESASIYGQGELCRIVRAFVARKPSAAEPGRKSGKS
ncbi:hypothetical protein JAAARDRAFT_35950 [Jaapia argillacea MUCL 33604]|uniref:Methyltransferase domain-containing protein n=1 Tax=Jaapia argillacea MUCL 33604 TaxID=933084 RepID=A0A067PU10_9AGAM|nr:hypothetical protein JAAARDRAFT_35950 [Jaapia argillacea MUCL 33604]